MKNLITLFSLFAASPLFAALAVDPIFGDHMVVQRDAAVRISGTSDAASVRGSFLPEGTDAQPVSVPVKNGRWTFVFPASPASLKPMTFVVANDRERVRIADILVGDVWICAGQSNMEFPMSREAHATAELPKAGDAGLRLLNHSFPGQYTGAQPLKPEQLAAMTPQAFYSGSWSVDSPESAAPMSGVGYYFARVIRREAGVPVGLINYAVGGIPIEGFMATGLLKEKFPAKVRGDWLKNASIDAWCRGRAAAHLGAGAATAPRDTNGPNHCYKPGFAFAAGIGRLADFPVRGVLWYQGESNAIEPARIEEYPALFKAMVTDWRTLWKRPQTAFYYAQLSSCASGKDRDLWPEFRDGQRLSLADFQNAGSSLFGLSAAEIAARKGAKPGPVGMVVTSDVGAERDVHPRDKKTVGERFARWALHDIYGKTDVVVSGPLAASAEVKSGAIVVSFSYAKGLKSSTGDRPLEFEIAGPDGKFVPAEAKIEGETVVVSARRVTSPKAVRYGWKPFAKANLTNGEGLPASTFLLRTR